MNNTYKPDQQKLALALTQELFDVIAKYEGAIMMSTMIGILETIKFDLIHHQHHELKEKIDANGQA